MISEEKIYRQGRHNLSSTIFVPYDCINNCPFCTSKSDYKDKLKFNMDEIIKKIKLLNKNEIIKEFVITGGEPFANPQELLKIINACEKNVYINTTLPKSTFNEALQIINNNDIIKGINISRHIGLEFPNVASLEEIDLIKKSIRINTVLIENSFDFDKFKEFCHKYGKKRRDINLRGDYRKISKETLKNRDHISDFLATEFDYIANESCMVCNSEYYSVNDKFIVAYHRGLEHSCVEIGNKFYVNDILIKQDGNIYKDWDCVRDENFENWILYNK